MFGLHTEAGKAPESRETFRGFVFNIRPSCKKMFGDGKPTRSGDDAEIIQYRYSIFI